MHASLGQAYIMLQAWRLENVVYTKIIWSGRFKLIPYTLEWYQEKTIRCWVGLRNTSYMAEQKQQDAMEY